MDHEDYLKRVPDLKPCPFCGGRPYETVKDGALHIRCHGCSAHIIRYLVPPASWTEAVDSCRDAWNRRVS